MKKIKRWRYYCDHCKKVGGSGGHMKKHEEICTKNPDRKCGFCRIMEETQAKMENLTGIINKLIVWICQEDDNGNSGWEWAEFKTGESETTVLIELRTATNNCPACILSAMRQTKTTDLFPSFKYIAEKKAMFSECNPEPDYSDYY